jgi:hypothetical protein
MADAAALRAEVQRLRTLARGVWVPPANGSAIASPILRPVVLSTNSCTKLFVGHCPLWRSPIARLSDRHGEGFRMPSGVGKPPKHEPAGLR